MSCGTTLFGAGDSFDEAVEELTAVASYSRTLCRIRPLLDE